MNKIMKSAIIFKQMFIAMAALTMVGCLSSCKDQNFDWDYAHANTAQAKFTDAFVKAYGKPAAGHQWGFDMAYAAMGGEIVISEGTTRTPITRGVTIEGVNVAEDSYFKQDMNINGIRVYTMFGRPKNITANEHAEVFAWFSNHKVGWENTPVNYDHKDGSGNYDSRNTMIKTANAVDTWTNPNLSNSENWQIQSTNDGKIRAYEISSNYTELGYGSLLNDRTKNHVGVDYIDDNNLVFRNAWIQSVAGHMESDTCALGDTHDKVDCSKMNYIAFRSLKEGDYWVHAKDYNNPSTNENSSDGYTSGDGNWGWGHQPTDEQIASGTDISNAGLLLNANFNTMTFSCSLDNEGNKLHNKYFVVYLKGSDYEGYYLGMDLESISNSDCDKNIPADGICNDWIIKIGDAGGNTGYESIRIMCEDLGGKTGNNVAKGDRYLVSDIDYNDIVLDVISSSNSKARIQLILQAAGGTIPLTVWYGNTALFETHELFKNTSLCSDENHYMTVPEYQVMYNTSKTEETGKFAKATPKTVELLFGGEGASNSENSRSIEMSGSFDLSKLHLKVWRFDTTEYLNSNDYSEAVWVNLDNIQEEAPLQFCVPLYKRDWTKVQWLIEREEINNGYPSFVEWVGNPSVPFWESPKTIYTNYLYQ